MRRHCRYSHRDRERSPRGCAPPRVRDTWPAVLRSWPVRVQQAGAMCDFSRRGLVQLQGRGHRVPRAMESSRNRPAGELLDLGQAADFGPQGDVHGKPPSWLGCGAAMAWRRISPSCISPWPAPPGRRWPGGGRESTWVSGPHGRSDRGPATRPGPDQSWQGHPQRAGQRAVAIERQPVPVGHGSEEEVQQHGLAREIGHVLAHEATIHPGPARCGGRRSREEPECAFGSWLGSWK